MLRWLILVVAVVLLSGAATLVFQFFPEPEERPKVPVVTKIEGPQPKIEIEGPLVYDFGTMARHDEAHRDWVVKNTGDAPLKIKLQGQTTCSCTVSRPGEKETLTVPPGESDVMGLNWHTKKDLPEDYSQGATFETNDPRHPTFMLTVKGKVYPAVSIYPPEMIQFPRISNEEPHSAKIAVYSKERPDLKLTELTSSKPGLIVADAKPMTEEEAKSLKITKGYLVTVTVKPGMPLGTFHEELIVRTDHPKQSEIKVSVHGNTFGPISVTPNRVRMVNVSGKKGISKDVVLVVRHDKDEGTDFQIVKKPPALKVAVVRDENSKLKGRYKLTVTVPPGTASGEVRGDIVLKTDNPRASEVKIPVMILVTQSGA